MMMHSALQFIKWQPTPVPLPGKSHGQRSLVGYSPWGCSQTWMDDFSFTFHLTSEISRSVQFSRLVISDSLWPHELQHARPPFPSPTPRVYSNLCPLNWWCHPTISSSVIHFSFYLQSFPAMRAFPMSQLFSSGDQSIGISASASVLPMNTQDLSLGWTGWMSFQSKGLSRVFSNTTFWKHQFFGSQLSL